jgi:hypothetical protein
MRLEIEAEAHALERMRSPAKTGMDGFARRPGRALPGGRVVRAHLGGRGDEL